MDTKTRCAWVPVDDPLYVAYHDSEWGVPSHDDRHLLEMLVLEGSQAGLSWSTILHRRSGYRRAFAGFDPAEVARFGPADVDRLLADPGIIRHRGKIEAAIANANAALAVSEQHGSLDAFLWGLVPDAPIRGGAGHPGRDAGIESAQQGAQAARIQVSRTHHVLRLHAGRGHGQRPRGRVLSV